MGFILTVFVLRICIDDLGLLDASVMSLNITYTFSTGLTSNTAFVQIKYRFWSIYTIYAAAQPYLKSQLQSWRSTTESEKKCGPSPISCGLPWPHKPPASKKKKIRKIRATPCACTDGRITQTKETQIQ